MKIEKLQEKYTVNLTIPCFAKCVFSDHNRTMQMWFQPTPENIFYVLFTCQGNLIGHAKLIRGMREVLFEMQCILLESLWV